MPNNHLPVRWDPVLRDTYKLLADESGRTVADVVREALRAYAGSKLLRLVKAKAAAQKKAARAGAGSEPTPEPTSAEGPAPDRPQVSTKSTAVDTSKTASHTGLRTDTSGNL
jgi:hypothetical protein